MVKGIDFRYAKLFERIEVSLSVDELTPRQLQEFLGFKAYGGLNQGRKDLLILPFTLKEEAKKATDLQTLINLRNQAEALPIHEKQVTDFINDRMIELEERRISIEIAKQVDAQFREKRTGKIIKIKAIPEIVTVRGKPQKRLRDLRGRFVAMKK